MNYRLINKKQGVKSFEVISEFQTDCEIIDVLLCKNNRIFCLSNESLIEIVNGMCKDILQIKNAMSMSAVYDNSILIAYQDGLKLVNFDDKYYSSDRMSKNEYDIIFGSLSKIGIKNIFIDFNCGYTGIALKETHKIYKLRGESIEKIYGNGIPEYSVSSNLNMCSMNSPQGIVIYNKDSLIVSDTGNGCIRFFGKDHRIITGNPLSNSISPTKLLINTKRNCLYYLSKNYLRSVNVDGSRDVVLYEGKTDEIKSIAISKDDKVYVLEGKI